MDDLHHAVDLVENLVVPEAQDAIAAGVQKSGSPFIGGAVLLIRMLPAIHLDDQAMMMAGEVRVVLADGCLSAEMDIRVWQAPEMPPEFLLRVGHGAAQLAGTRDARVGFVILWLDHRSRC